MLNYVAILCLSVMVVVNGAPARSKRSNANCGADIAFVLDTSGIVGNEGFEKEKNFVRSFMAQLVEDSGAEVGRNGFQGAIVTYTSVQAILASSNDRKAFNTSLNEATFKPSMEYPSPALSMVKDSVFTKLMGERPDFPNLVVFISDGIVTAGVPINPIVPAQALRDSGAQIIAVGIPVDWSDKTNYVDSGNLAGIAGSQKNVFSINQKMSEIVKFLSSPPFSLLKCPGS